MEPTPIWIKGTYEAGFMDGTTLVIAATSDDELNGRICEEAASIPLPALNVSHGELEAFDSLRPARFRISSR